jgi:hypothetical protein
MSGSPVYIDGKLVGAVAFGFPFSKETIAGITPIAEMISAAGPAVERAAPVDRLAPRRLHLPVQRSEVLESLRQPLGPAPVFAGPAGQLTPLSVPLVLSGFDSRSLELARGLFAGLGFAPVAGGAASAGSLQPEMADLAPGGPVGVTLLEGDLDITATGTVTHIDGDRVYAFGHPFYNLGPTQFPMKKAYVYSVFPSLYQSWKISTAGATVGTIEQDRNTAIAGRLGAAPRMIPIQVHLRGSRGADQTFSLRMVDDDLFSPLLTFVGVQSLLQANERAYGASTLQVEARVALSNGREVRLEDLFSGDQSAQQAALLVATPLVFLMSNDFEKVSIARVDVTLSSVERLQTGSLQRAWIERPLHVRPGVIVPLKVQVRGYRGEVRTESLPVSIPPTARPGQYALLVADGTSLTALEQRELRQTSFQPRDLDQLMRALNSLRRNNRIYVRLLRAEEGAVVGGEFLQSLPPSVLSVLDGPEQQAGNVVPVRASSVWDFDLPTDYAFSGSRSIPLTVER